MSVRENLELYGLTDEEQYVEILTTQLGATKHPTQLGAYIVESLPFNAPRHVEGHIAILSFNYVPPPVSLIQALVDHIELFPDEILVR